MKTMPVGELKAHFSEVLDEVRQGRTIGVSYGRKGGLVAVIAPPELLARKVGVKFGLLEGKASFCLLPGFKMSDEELLGA
jgi:hypothetical protein